MRSETYAAALARCNAARKAVGLGPYEAEAVTVEPTMTIAGEPPELAASLVCWRCEESADVDGAADEAAHLRRFWREHRQCKPEPGTDWFEGC
jgi:hypothetical protein